MFRFYLVLLFISATFLSFPKIDAMMICIKQIEPFSFSKLMFGGGEECYGMFPWMEPEQQIHSSSGPLWLLIHLIISYIHLVSIIFTFFYREYYQGQYYDQFIYTDPSFISFTHHLFILVLLPNINHFSQLGMGSALLVNGIPLYLLYFTFRPRSSTKFLDFIYVTILSSPIILETILYLSSF